MRLPGRRHWTETVDVLTVTPGTGPNAGIDTTRTALSNERCSVQPASNAVALRHGITTGNPLYWLRFAASPPSMSDFVKWRDQYYRVIEISEGNNIDTQVLMRLSDEEPSSPEDEE